MTYILKRSICIFYGPHLSDTDFSLKKYVNYASIYSMIKLK
jgi:hypothetical protein